MSRLHTRRGFTLAEVLVALVLTMAVGGALLGLLLTHQRVALVQGEQAALQGSVRAAAAIVGLELREAGTLGGIADLLVLGSDSITYRAFRFAGIACQVAPDEVRILATPWHGYRQPQPGRDSLLLFIEGDTALASDDRWVALPVLGVSTGSTCGSRSALALGTVIDTLTLPPKQVVLGAPARGFEVQQLKLYSSSGQYWLGTRSVSAGEVIQPAAGPLSASGLELAYLDSANMPTTLAAQVRAIQAVVRGVSSRMVQPTQGPRAFLADSIRLTVSLPNATPF